MTARAASAVCRRQSRLQEFDVDLGHPQAVVQSRCGSTSQCPCQEFKEEAVKPSLWSRLGIILFFQKDTSAACIGCWADGEEVTEDGKVVATCDYCRNQPAKLRLESAIEALGGVMA